MGSKASTVLASLNVVAIRFIRLYLLLYDSPPPVLALLSRANCFGHDLGGDRHMPSVRTNAQIPFNEFLPQLFGFVSRQPTVVAHENACCAS
jgi:hypothetical protein